MKSTTVPSMLDFLRRPCCRRRALLTVFLWGWLGLAFVAAETRAQGDEVVATVVSEEALTDGASKGQTQGPEAAGGGDETLRVITSLQYPPFSFRSENGAPRGFDLDLVHLVALKLGKTVTIEEVPFDELLSRLNQGRADLALDAITPTASRKLQVDFSDPYFHVPNCVLSHEGLEIKKPEDLKGKTIAVQKGSTQTGLVKHLKEQGFVGKVLVTGSLEQSVGAVKDGTADVAVMECASAEQYVRLGNTLEAQHLPLKHMSQPISIAVTKKSPYLEKINRIIHELKTDKVIGGLARRWFGPEHAGGEHIDGR